MEKPTILTLIRHGLSDFNIAGRYQGSGNLAQLSDTGIKQAYRVGDALGNHSIDVIYASPLLRTSQTAEIIAKVIRHPHPVRFDDRLREVDIPDWQGLTYSEIQDKSPALLKIFHECPEKFEMYSDGILRRPLSDLYQRVSGFMSERISSSNSRILVVSHLGTNQALINVALGLSESNHHRIQQSQCAVSRLKLNAAGAVKLTKLNDVGHFGHALPKVKSQKSGVRVIFLGFADRVNLLALDFSILNVEKDSVWVENVLDPGKLTLPLKPAVFGIGSDGLDKSLTERIKRLRMCRNHMNTLLIVARSASLTTIAESLFEIPRELMASVGNSTEFAMVIHDSTEHARPIVQLLSNSTEDFLKQ